MSKGIFLGLLAFSFSSLKSKLSAKWTPKNYSMYHSTPLDAAAAEPAALNLNVTVSPSDKRNQRKPGADTGGAATTTVSATYRALKVPTIRVNIAVDVGGNAEREGEARSKGPVFVDLAKGQSVYDAIWMADSPYSENDSANNGGRA